MKYDMIYWFNGEKPLMHSVRPFCLYMLDKILLVLSIQELMHDVVITIFYRTSL